MSAYGDGEYGAGAYGGFQLVTSGYGSGLYGAGVYGGGAVVPPPSPIDPPRVLRDFEFPDEQTHRTDEDAAIALALVL